MCANGESCLSPHKVRSKGRGGFKKAPCTELSLLPRLRTTCPVTGPGGSPRLGPCSSCSLQSVQHATVERGGDRRERKRPNARGRCSTCWRPDTQLLTELHATLHKITQRGDSMRWPLEASPILRLPDHALQHRRGCQLQDLPKPCKPAGWGLRGAVAPGRPVLGPEKISEIARTFPNSSEQAARRVDECIFVQRGMVPSHAKPRLTTTAPRATTVTTCMESTARWRSRERV